MRIIFYQFLIFLSKILGRWVFELFAWFVASAYFLFFPARVANSLRFYQVLFPGQSRFYHLWCAWRQFHNFTDVFFDRFFLQKFGDLTYSSEGLEHLEKALKDKSGGILLMSHIGNWEIAAHLLKRGLQDIRLLLYMGVKHKEQIEGIQKESLVQSGIRIVAVEEDGGSPMDIVEGINFIKSGGVVSVTGDIVWKRDQRTIPVMFLGHEVRLPQTPHLFALLSGAPIFIFFAFRTGKNKYHFSMSEPISLVPASRSERDAVIRHSAQRYADTIEAMVRNYPLQWYHFKSFLPSKPK